MFIGEFIDSVELVSNLSLLAIRARHAVISALESSEHAATDGLISCSWDFAKCDK